MHTPIKPDEDILDHISKNYVYREGKIFSNIMGREIGHYHTDKGRYYITTGNSRKNSLIRSRAHIVWFLCKGEWPQYELDHKDRDKTNDKIENLRYSNRSQQEVNKIHKRNKQGYKGIYKVAKGYQVQIWKDGIRHIVGYYKDKETAYFNYKNKYIELWGTEPI